MGSIGYDFAGTEEKIYFLNSFNKYELRQVKKDWMLDIVTYTGIIKTTSHTSLQGVYSLIEGRDEFEQHH